MNAQKASHSAAIVAAHRAIESEKPANERVCYDPFASRFLPPGFTVIGKHKIPSHIALNLFKDILPGFHEFFLARTRYIDDSLHNSIHHDIKQLIILGAGYDSRAYRFDELKKETKVFEVDHPVTQKVKTDKLLELFEVLPKHVTFVPVEFGKDNLKAHLSENGYNNRLKSLFIWEGVTMYLDQKAVEETLLFISKNSGEKSEVIFDYTYPEVINGTSERKEAKEWLKITQKSDEQVYFGISNDDIEKFLLNLSFCDIAVISQ